MKWFRSRPRRSLIARVLALVMLAPYLAMAPPPAEAQNTLISTYVLDFNNKTRVGGQLLGRVAAAQMSLQMAESTTWEVVPDAQVQQRVQTLGLQPPFDRVDRQRIATGVDASAVVYGTIQDARVSGGTTPQAFVRIQVLVEDITSGVLINGAVAEGASTRRMGFTGDADVLLEEAIGKATFKAREFMDRFRLPEGTVLNTTVVGAGGDADLDVLLNIGARQGVRQGMEMIVTRLREPVGRLRVTSVDSDVSTARVVENTQGVRPEDRARAIFNFADFPVTRARLRSAAEAPQKVAAKAGPGAETEPAGEKGAEKGAEKPARVASAAPGGLFEQFRSQDQNGQPGLLTVQAPPPVVVDEPDVERGGGGGGRSGFAKLLGRNTFKMLVGGLLVLGILAVGGRAGRAATRAHAVESTGYQPSFGAAGAFIRVCWDRPKSVRSDQVIQYVVYRNDNFGDQQIVGAVNSDAVRCFTDSEAVRTVTNVFTGAPNGIADDQDTLEDVPGIVAGQQYRYQVATVYENGLEDRDDDGEPDDEDFISPLSMVTGVTTAIAPPAITDPQNSEPVQLDLLSVTWSQTPGADTYTIWVSTEPTFPPARRASFGPFNVLPVDQGGDQELTRVIDARDPALGDSPRRVFISVGARNSQDQEKPRPWGYVFSSPVQVQPEVIPPPPPGAGVAGLDKKARAQKKNGKGSSINTPGKGKDKRD